MDIQADADELFRTHEVRVFTYFLRMLPTQPEVARDLTQETFYRAIRGIHRFRGDSSLSTWLFGIARRVFADWLRTRREVPSDRLPDSAVPDQTRDFDVERTLQLLDPEDREVLVLRFALDLPGEEVAAILGISHGAVRQRVLRAKAEFRNRWGP